ncbi:pantoate--beta-alanine ligase [Paenibacillus pini]|uniref:Pantothenate synthetase n=1 Tax=Paenibacillus pini JCM 16418 TaxID=1236976 RepID=W7YNB8_9BACL|nr:pantoate--beta-alanine ligase [Paenibacillus pini]GAF09098.1 pantoate-beta-alanine ligase [Paenibacillus pini JCM 16418]
MKVVRTITELRSELKDLKSERGVDGKIGLVPTMGFLHQGHASLMRKAKDLSQIVVISIFVNPIQFGPGEDFETYPRNEAQDLELAEKEGVDLVFIPTVEEMYPVPTKTIIHVSAVTERLCGASRPGHFDGVTTVVSKLFNIVQPDMAFFGMKDAQQVAVLQQMVNDLNINVDIVPCPIIREQDGLALSSRNVYLSAEDRAQALVLSRSLQAAKQALESGEARTAQEVRDVLVSIINQSSHAVIDYTEVLSFPTLEPYEDHEDLSERNHATLIALAVKFGKTRLIDNVLIESKEECSHV